MTLAYVGSHGDRLQRQRDTNPVTSITLPDGTVVYGRRQGSQPLPNPRVNPQFGQLISANTFAESDYHSFQAALNRRLSHNIQSQVSYTWSRCRDTTSGNSDVLMRTLGRQGASTLPASVSQWPLAL